MRWLLATGFLLTWAGAAAPLSLADDAPADGDLFKQLDSNGDGKVAADEAALEHRLLVERLVRHADADGDSLLTEEEFTAGIAEQPDRPLELEDGPRGPNPRARGAIFSRLDRDGDGKVAADDVPEERRARFARWLERGDHDGDEMLSREEFDAVAELPADDGRLPRRRRDDGPRRPGGSPEDARGPQGRGPMPPFPNPVIRALDEDGDGELSAAEISAASEALKKLDRNDDGQLDRSELGPPLPRPWREGPQGAGPPGRPGRPPHGEPFDGPPGPDDRHRPRGDQRRDGPRPFEGDRPPHPDDESRPRPPRRPEGPPPDERPAAQLFERIMNADEDGDGEISKDEAPERLQRVFDRLDADGDGALDQSELRKHVERMHKRLEERRPEGRPRGKRTRPDGAPGPGPADEPGDPSASAPDVQPEMPEPSEENGAPETDPATG